jgi:hypothetical protein
MVLTLRVKIHLGYAGDHDAPGVRMDGYVKFSDDQGDILNRLWEQDDLLRLWAEHKGKPLPRVPAPMLIRVERILVTTDDLDRDDLRPIPVKKTHHHRDEYVRRFGDRALEADFLRSDEIVSRVTNWIESQIDWDIWARSRRNGQRLRRDVLRRTETPRRLLRIEHKPGDHRTTEQKLRALAKNSAATPAEREAARAALARLQQSK